MPNWCKTHLKFTFDCDDDKQSMIKTLESMKIQDNAADRMADEYISSKEFYFGISIEEWKTNEPNMLRITGQERYGHAFDGWKAFFQSKKLKFNRVKVAHCPEELDIFGISFYTWKDGKVEIEEVREPREEDIDEYDSGEARDSSTEDGNNDAPANQDGTQPESKQDGKCLFEDTDDEDAPTLEGILASIEKIDENANMDVYLKQIQGISDKTQILFGNSIHDLREAMETIENKMKDFENGDRFTILLNKAKRFYSEGRDLLSRLEDLDAWETHEVSMKTTIECLMEICDIKQTMPSAVKEAMTMLGDGMHLFFFKVKNGTSNWHFHFVELSGKGGWHDFKDEATEKTEQYVKEKYDWDIFDHNVEWEWIQL